MLFLLLSCTEMGSEIDVAFFWTNMLIEVFLVWWYCTISNISGTICHFEHSLSPNFSSGIEERKKNCQHEMFAVSCS